MESKQLQPIEESLNAFMKYIVYFDRYEAGDDTPENVESMNKWLAQAKEYYLLNLEQTLKVTGAVAENYWQMDKIEFERNSLKTYTSETTGKEYCLHYYPYYRTMLQRWKEQLHSLREENLEDLRNIQSLTYKDGFTGQQMSDMVSSNFDDGADIREQMILCVAHLQVNIWNRVEYSEALTIAEFYWQSMIQDEIDRYWKN
jgi:hypothetical protein